MASVERRATSDGQVRWDVRYRVGGRPRKKTFRTKRPADEFAAKVEYETLAGTFLDVTSRVTVREYLATYPETRVLRPTTLQRHAWIAGKVNPLIGDLQLRGVADTDVTRTVTTLSRSLSTSTVRNIHGVLSGVFAQAVRERLIAANPCTGTPLPRPGETTVVPLERGQVDALHAAAPGHLAALIVAGAGSGLRPGELLGLEVDAVDFLRREMHVRRQLVTIDRRPVFLGPPKTPSSVRTVPLSYVVLETLAEHLRLHPPTAIDLLDTSGRRDRIRPVELVFRNRAGAPWKRQRFSDAWRRTVVKAGLDAGTRAHDLRHTFAATLISGGASPKVVQRLLGHKTIAETLDTYGHLMDGDLERARDAVQLALASRDQLSSVSRVP